jgi:predicted AlkP superfamily phosphohydrolase/phosphomutase
VLFVGVDACDLDLAQRLARAGRLPTIARLLREAAVVETRAPLGVYVGATWTTFFTGLSAATVDYYCWASLERGGYDIVDSDPADIEAPPFWRTLSDAGRRVGVFDVPHSQVEDLDGAIVAEWGCHDRHFGTGSSPVDLVAELDEVAGRHPIGTRDDGGPSAPCDRVHREGAHRTRAESEQLWADLVGAQRCKHDASLHLLEKGGWDLYLSVLGESHCTGHQLFHVHDVDHPRHDPEVRAAVGDPLVQMYEQLDATIGAHLDAAGDDAVTYVLLSHGMQRHNDGDHLLDQVLHRFAGVDAHRDAPGWRSRVAESAFGFLPERQGAWARRQAAPLVRRRIRGAPPAPNPDLPPRETRPWFHVPNNTATSGLRVNVVGRDPSGIVEPGRELEDTYERLGAWLYELVNVDTGEPVVIDVVRADDHYERKPESVLPDLFVEWNRDAPIERVWSPRIGCVFGPYEHWRTGDHHPRGLLLASGGGIVAGRRREPVDIIDLGPTIASNVGVDLPDVEGVVLEDLVGDRR